MRPTPDRFPITLRTTRAVVPVAVSAIACALPPVLVARAAHAADDAGPATAEIGLWALSAVALGLLSAVVYYRRRLKVQEIRANGLERELERERSVIDTAPEMLLCWDRNTGDQKLSDAAMRLLGVSRDEPVGAAEIGKLVAPEDRTALHAAVTALLDDATAFDLSADGPAARRFSFAGRIVGLADNKHLAVLWIRDESELARAVSEARRHGDGFRKMLDALPFPVWRRNRSLVLDYVNPAYLDAVEAAPDTPPVTVPELAAGAIRDNGRALAARAMETRDSQSEPHHIVAAGDRRLMLITEAPAGGDGAIAGFAVDRTEIEEVRSELALHIANHEDVLHKLGTAIAIYGADQRLDFYNTAFVKLWQLDESRLDSRPAMAEVLEWLRDDRRIPEQANFPQFKTERLAQFTSLIEPLEELAHLPDGKTVRAVVSPHPFGGLLLTWEDVTASLALERSYNTLIAVQKETLDNLYEGVAVIGADGRVQLSNPSFRRIWQMTEEELEAAPHVSQLVERMRDLLDGGNWDDQRAELIELLTGRDGESGRVERADGSVVDYATVPLPDGGVLLSYINVSDSHRVEQFLRERNEALETADRLKSEFIANVSYELRTPLNTIIGFSEILSGEYFGELNQRQAEYSSGILESSQRLLSLINDILDLATIESGHMSLELDSVDLNELLASVLGLTRERVIRKNLKLDFDCPDDIGVIVADQRRLKQALFNILSNSVKFTPEEGEITVSARRVEDHVIITFTDTGIGIPPEDHKRVFRRFERGNHPEARRSGAGLGLSLVQSFIELHGGHVELESEPEVGTKVVCRLPARKAIEEAPLLAGNG